jgi:hypothetical protein
MRGFDYWVSVASCILPMVIGNYQDNVFPGRERRRKKE